MGLIEGSKKFVLTHSMFMVAFAVFLLLFSGWNFVTATHDYLLAHYEHDRIKWKAWTEVMCTPEVMEVNAHNDNMINQISHNCNLYVPIVSHSTDQYVLDLALFHVIFYADGFLRLLVVHYVISGVLISFGTVLLYFLQPWRMLRKQKVE